MEEGFRQKGGRLWPGRVSVATGVLPAATEVLPAATGVLPAATRVLPAAANDYGFGLEAHGFGSQGGVFGTNGLFFGKNAFSAQVWVFRGGSAGLPGGGGDCRLVQASVRARATIHYSPFTNHQRAGAGLAALSTRC